MLKKSKNELGTFFKVNGKVFAGDLSNCSNCHAQCAVNVVNVPSSSGISFINLKIMPCEYSFDENDNEYCEACA